MAPMANGTPQAIPVNPGVGRGLLRIVSNDTLVQQEQAAAEQIRRQEEEDQSVEDFLAGHIRARMTDMRNFRNAEGISVFV